MWGLGHLYRNVALIEEMTKRGVECEAIINNHEIAKEMLVENRIKVSYISEYESAGELISLLNRISNDEKKVVFWDRLNSDISYIKELNAAQIKIITYDNYDLSALLATECVNTRMIPLDKVVPRYSGPAYQIFKKEIREYARKEKTINQNAKKILLHFGGTDPLKILGMCYEALKDLENCNFEFIGGKEEDPLIVQRIKDSSNSIYGQGVTDFGRRLFESDICLVAGGVSMYEAAAIGTPMINICHNEDQESAATIFEQNVGSINLGIANKTTYCKILDAVCLLRSDCSKRRNMSRKMKSFVPSNGIEMVCDIIETVIGNS